MAVIFMALLSKVRERERERDRERQRQRKRKRERERGGIIESGSDYLFNFQKKLIQKYAETLKHQAS